MRSLLVVTPDSDIALDRALAAAADAIVIDLADSAEPAHRRRAATFLGETRGPARLFVRISPLASALAADDLDAVVVARPHGIVLPAAAGGSAVARLSAMLRPREATAGINDGAIAVIAMATDTPVGLVVPADYRDAGPRLAGIGWDADALAAALGTGLARDSAGGLRDAARLARTLTLAAAAAASVAAIDTAFTGPSTALEQETATARDDGFSGKFARAPDQVAAINRAFAPNPAETQ